MPFDDTKHTGLNLLIEHLRGLPPERFGMDYACGSACCIGGWANTLLGVPRRTAFLSGAVHRLTGIPIPDAEKICWPAPGSPAWEAKPHHAVALLERYRDHGIVDWELAMAAPAVPVLDGRA